jgi:nucleoside-diphosphate kinase
MERTLSVIKPDGVAKGIIGEVLKHSEANGLKIAALKMIHSSKKQAQGFYAVHREKPFFDRLTDFMSSGPPVVLILEGEGAIEKNRKIMGATDFRRADPGTIRTGYDGSIEQNIVHGSDGPETAQYEMACFFNALEIVN